MATFGSRRLTVSGFRTGSGLGRTGTVLANSVASFQLDEPGFEFVDPLLQASAIGTLRLRLDFRS